MAEATKDIVREKTVKRISEFWISSTFHEFLDSVDAVNAARRKFRANPDKSTAKDYRAAYKNMVAERKKVEADQAFRLLTSNVAGAGPERGARKVTSSNIPRYFASLDLDFLAQNELKNGLKNPQATREQYLRECDKLGVQPLAEAIEKKQ